MSNTDTTQDGNKGLKNVGRRALLKVAGAASVGLPLAAYLGRAPWRGPSPAQAHVQPRSRESYWRDGGRYFVHENVDASRFNEGIVNAKVEGEWTEFVNRRIGDDFLDWNMGDRVAILEDPMSRMQCLDGPHSGCLATYGSNRGDSVFSLNAAYKGFGFYPHEGVIDDFIAEVEDYWYDSQMTKMALLRTYYRDRAMWDTRLLSSLELYTTPEFETHSFLNQMANPVATICWMGFAGSGIKSFEVRAIARLIHPRDPDIPDIDFKRVMWVNMMHDFFHNDGSIPPPTADTLPWIACIYYNVEVFDDSPYPGPMGTRTTPPL